MFASRVTVSASARLWLLSSLLSPLAVCAACGGSGGESRDPSGVTEPTNDAANDGNAASSEQEPVTPAGPCAGDVCTPCGEAVCLQGFYCDEGLGACAWLPQCAGDPSCSCLSSHLDGCQCVERDGGLYVSCE